MTKHYVTFLFAGSLFPEERTEEITIENGFPEVPKNCFAYFMWDREEAVVDGETLVGKQKNKTGRYYFGKELTLKEVEQLYPDADILISNIKSNKWDTIVRTRVGNFQPLLENDVIVSEK